MFTKTLLPDTLRAIQLISAVPEIKKAYLAGGTALALQLGHRISVDLDFFTAEDFNEAEVVGRLSLVKSFHKEGTAKGTIWGKISRTRLSLFRYQYPLLRAATLFEGIALASLADIAAMKIHAIVDRGTRRDFVDVYFLSKKYSLDRMLGFYQEKYSALESNLYSILRALDYFEDAEKESQMPNMISKVDWEEVKDFFRLQTKKLMGKILSLR